MNNHDPMATEYDGNPDLDAYAHAIARGDERGYLEQRLSALQSDAPFPNPATYPAIRNAWPNGVAPARPFLVEAYLPLGEVSGLYGHGARGKSRLALQLAAAIASTDGLSTWIDGAAAPHVQGGGPVLFCSWEDDNDEQARRLAMMQGPQSTWLRPDALEQLHFLNMRGQGPTWAAERGRRGGWQDVGRRIHAAAEGMGAKLVVLDSLATAFQGNEIDRNDSHGFVNAWQQWAESREAAVLLVAHSSRAEDISGSTGWLNAPRSILVLKHGNGRNGITDGKTVLEHNKANYTRPWDTLTLEQDNERPLLWRVRGRLDDELAEVTIGYN